jgi:fibronectin type 3 domain-containing protein
LPTDDNIIAPLNSNSKRIKNLNVYSSKLNKYIEVNWFNSENNVSLFWVYKSTNGSKLQLYSVLPQSKKRFVDEDLRSNNKYTYAVKAVYKDGSSSKLETIDVIF